jgi:hypothetical protein
MKHVKKFEQWSGKKVETPQQKAERIRNERKKKLERIWKNI